MRVDPVARTSRNKRKNIMDCMSYLKIAWEGLASESGLHGDQLSYSSSTSVLISSTFLDNVVAFSFRNLSGCSLNSISDDSFRNLKLLKKL